MFAETHSNDGIIKYTNVVLHTFLGGVGKTGGVRKEVNYSRGIKNRQQLYFLSFFSF